MKLLHRMLCIILPIVAFSIGNTYSSQININNSKQYNIDKKLLVDSDDIDLTTLALDPFYWTFKLKDDKYMVPLMHFKYYTKYSKQQQVNYSVFDPYQNRYYILLREKNTNKYFYLTKYGRKEAIHSNILDAYLDNDNIRVDKNKMHVIDNDQDFKEYCNSNQLLQDWVELVKFREFCAVADYLGEKIKLENNSLFDRYYKDSLFSNQEQKYNINDFHLYDKPKANVKNGSIKVKLWNSLNDTVTINIQDGKFQLSNDAKSKLAEHIDFQKDKVGIIKYKDEYYLAVYYVYKDYSSSWTLITSRNVIHLCTVAELINETNDKLENSFFNNIEHYLGEELKPGTNCKTNMHKDFKNYNVNDFSFYYEPKTNIKNGSIKVKLWKTLNDTVTINIQDGRFKLSNTAKIKLNDLFTSIAEKNIGIVKYNKQYYLAYYNWFGYNQRVWYLVQNGMNSDKCCITEEDTVASRKRAELQDELQNKIVILESQIEEYKLFINDKLNSIYNLFKQSNKGIENIEEQVNNILNYLSKDDNFMKRVTLFSEGEINQDDVYGDLNKAYPNIVIPKAAVVHICNCLLETRNCYDLTKELNNLKKR